MNTTTTTTTNSGATKSTSGGHERDLRAAMERDGYVVVPNVLTTRQVGALRAMVTRFCDANRGTYFQNESKANLNVFASEPDEMRSLLGHPGIADVIKQIAGPDVMYMRELGVGIGGSSGWHKDTHGLQRSVRGEHDDYGVYKILVYPQDHIGLTEDDFALKVRRGSHWIPDPQVGDVDTLYTRAGDILVIDCRTSHRGRNSTTEQKNLLARALYYPFNRKMPELTFNVRRSLWRLSHKPERQIVTILFGKKNAFTEEYMRQGRANQKKRWPSVDVDLPLPESWQRDLDSVGISY